MSREVNMKQTCSRLCLLTTLLFLLCIYIKRVNATSCSQDQDTLEELNVAHQITSDGAIDFELNCPVEKSVQIKGVRNKTITQLKDKLIKQAKLCAWRKDNEPFHRDNGHIVFKNDTDEFKLSLLAVGPSDQGQYSCIIKFPDILPNEEQLVKQHLKLFDILTFSLIVDQQPLPDIPPIISHHPTDLFLHKGQNARFECKSIATLMSKVTYWFKSNCHQANDSCCEIFDAAFKNAQFYSDPLYVHDYVIRGKNNDELHLTNVSESDVGSYGCYVTNKKGSDIRLGSLKLLNVPATIATHSTNSTILASPTPSTTTTTSTTTTSTTTTPTTTTVTTTTPLPSSTSTSPYGTNATTTILPIKEVPTQASTNNTERINYQVWICFTLVFIMFLYIAYHLHGCPKADKKSELHHNLIAHAPIVGETYKEINLRQHLPNADCPDIFSVGKSVNGFISGHCHQKADHVMSQSICSGILDKEKNPSISSNSNSDEASSLDNSRKLYLHTSNTTTTTVPMYDHPPSASTRYFGAIVQDACVINPTYGFLRPETDATEWIFPRRNLERLNKIGEGQFGEVWRYIARNKDGSVNYVAVKQLKNRAGLGYRERLELISEIEIMKLVNDHPNVIKLMYYCADDYEPLLLIMEYAEIGKLQTYLRSCRSLRIPHSCINSCPSKTTVTSKELVKFSYHIAKGMEYVASKGLIHRDLASRNILVSKDKVCKVADFGFARRVNDECAYERTTTSPVPVKWMAPEALVENKFTSKSDVFSFGILMWEIVTLGATPYEYLTSSEVYKKVTTGGRLERPLHCSEEFYKIMSSCWSHNPTDRPTFNELAFQLEKLLLSDKDYIELDQYPEHAYYNILNVAEKEIVHVDP